MKRRQEEIRHRCMWRVSLGLLAATSTFMGVAAASELHPLDDLRIACETGDGGACNTLGRTYETKTDLWGAPVIGAASGPGIGNGVRRKDATAARYYQQACSLGFSDGCHRLGRMYETGKGVARSEVKAQQLYRRACVLRKDAACVGRPVKLRD